MMESKTLTAEFSVLTSADGKVHHIRGDDNASCHDNCIFKSSIFAEHKLNTNLVYTNQSLDVPKCETVTIIHGKYTLTLNLHFNMYDNIIKFMDTNKDGNISNKEFTDNNKHSHHTPDEVETIFNIIDTDKSGSWEPDEQKVLDLDNSGLIDSRELELVSEKVVLVDNLVMKALEYLNSSEMCVCAWILDEIKKNLIGHIHTKISHSGTYKILYDINNNVSHQVDDPCDNACYTKDIVHTDATTKKLITNFGMLHSENTSVVPVCYIEETTSLVVHLFLTHLTYTFNSYKAEKIHGELDVSKLLDTLVTYDGYQVDNKYLLVVGLPNISEECKASPTMYLDNYLYPLDCASTNCQTKHACVKNKDIDLHTGHSKEGAYKCYTELMASKKLCTYAQVDNVLVVTLKDATSTESY